MAVKRGLGRGLDNLIPTGDDKKGEATAAKQPVKTEVKEIVKEVVKEVERTININKIEPNKSQPRKHFDEDALAELADSIKQYGIIEPLVVAKRNKYYEIIAGERRWRAARLEIALIENIQREDLNPIEEAHAYERLIKEFNLKQDEVAERVSKSRTTITNSLRLLKLAEPVQQMLIDDMLTTGHVRVLISIEDSALQYDTALYVFDKKLSVRETESYVKKVLKGGTPKKAAEVTEDFSFLYKEIEERLKNTLGTKTTIKASGRNKGKIEIEYYSEEDLDRIAHMLYNER